MRMSERLASNHETDSIGEEMADDGDDSSYSHHWVEQLFPATFVFSWDKFIEDLETVRKEKKLPTVVSPLDVSAIKNVYERVYMRNIIEDEERKLQAEKDKHESIDKLNTTEDQAQNKEKQLDTSGIWNSTEIGVLREVFKSAKQQNSQFKFTIQDLNEQLTQSQEKCKELEKLLKSRTSKLGEVLKANQRLTIQCDTCSKELKGAQERIVNLSKKFTEVKTLRAQELLNHQDLCVKMEKLRMENRKIENKIEKMNEEYLHDRTVREDGIKLIYDKEITFVLDRLDDMTQCYENERDEHMRTRNALDHLRKHFGAIQDGGESSAGKDIITQIDYYPSNQSVTEKTD